MDLPRQSVSALPPGATAPRNDEVVSDFIAAEELRQFRPYCPLPQGSL